jgi:hypothetical protein
MLIDTMGLEDNNLLFVKGMKTPKPLLKKTNHSQTNRVYLELLIIKRLYLG